MVAPAAVVEPEAAAPAAPAALAVAAVAAVAKFFSTLGNEHGGSFLSLSFFSGDGNPIFRGFPALAPLDLVSTWAAKADKCQRIFFSASSLHLFYLTVPAG